MGFSGVSIHKTTEYTVIFVEQFSDDIKNALRNNLSSICHGENKVKSGRKSYSYQKTLKSFLDRYESKTKKIKIGMIGELLVHLLISEYFDEFKVVTPYFNMEENSIKKGFDIVLTESNCANIWITEVKSGEIHKDKNVKQTMIDLLGTAKRDLETRLNDENETLWMEAVNGATIALDDNNVLKSAVKDILEDWQDEASDGIYTSCDKNVMLAGVLFSINDGTINSEAIEKKQETITNENIFNQAYLLAIQKDTYTQMYQFLQNEVM